MPIKELIKDLLALYARSGVCQEQILEWKAYRTHQDLIDAYLYNPQYSLERGIPTPKFISRNFPEHLLLANKIYNRKELENLLVQEGDSLILQSSGSVTVQAWGISTIHIAFGSEIEISTENNSVVFVRVYDNSTVKIKDHPTARVSVVKYSNDCIVECGSSVKVKMNEKKNDNG